MALEQLRKEISRSLTETQRKTLKMHDRYLLLRRKHDLKPEELFVLESWIKSIPLLGQGYELKERFFAIYDQPTREKMVIGRNRAIGREIAW